MNDEDSLPVISGCLYNRFVARREEHRVRDIIFI